MRNFRSNLAYLSPNPHYLCQNNRFCADILQLHVFARPKRLGGVRQKQSISAILLVLWSIFGALINYSLKFSPRCAKCHCAPSLKTCNYSPQNRSNTKADISTHKTACLARNLRRVFELRLATKFGVLD
jgi:hypothetical protein